MSCARNVKKSWFVCFGEVGRVMISLHLPDEFLNYTIPLPPSGTNNAYHTGRAGNWYKDDNVKAWEKLCLWKLKGKVKKVKYTHWLCVDICFVFGDRRRRDIDSKIKFCLDLFQKAGAYKDDSEITDLNVHKRIDIGNPRMEIQIYGS